MSYGVYMKIVSHIVNDSEQAAAVSEKLTADLNRFIKSVYGENATDASWQQFAHETEGGCENITASFYEVVNGQAYEQMDEILSVIDTLKNGSYITLGFSLSSALCVNTFCRERT